MARKIFIGCCLIVAEMAWGEPAIKDRSVLGWWRFDSEGEKDVSGYGGGSYDLGTDGYVQWVGSGGYDGSGYVNINTKGKTFTVTLGTSAASIFNGTTTLPYYTLAMRFKGDKNMAKLPDEYKSIFNYEIVGYKEAHFGQVVNDHDSWHQVALRYQKSMGTGSSLAYMCACDYNIGDTYPAEAAGDSVDFPIKVSGTTVTIGGNLQSSDYKYYGDVDDLMIINRMMSKTELTRFYQTGETFVYPTGNQPGFSSGTGWSSVEVSWQPKPGNMPGAAYIVDDNKTMTQDGTATFGVDVANRVSLTLGRKAPLTFIDGNTEVTKQTAGNFNHSSAGTLTFYDLRLVNGKFAGVAGGALNTTLLDIDTASGSAFEFNVASGTYAISSANAVTGEGILKKTGAGTLDLTGLTGAAKVVVTEGKVLAGPNVTVTYDLEEDRGAVPVLMAE